MDRAVSAARRGGYGLTNEVNEGQRTPAAPAGNEAPSRPEGSGRSEERPAGGRGGRGGGGGRFGGRGGRRKVCAFCVDSTILIDYKDPMRLRRYVTERGKIEPRRKTGTCARHQRRITVAIKRARHLALLPFTGDHARGASYGAPTPQAARAAEPAAPAPAEAAPAAVPPEAPAAEVAAEAPAVAAAPETAPEPVAAAQTTETE